MNAYAMRTRATGVRESHDLDTGIGRNRCRNEIRNATWKISSPP